MNHLKEYYENETNTSYEDFLKAIDSELYAKIRETKEGFGNGNNTLKDKFVKGDV